MGLFRDLSPKHWPSRRVSWKPVSWRALYAPYGAYETENAIFTIVRHVQRFSQPNPSQIIQNRDQLIRKLYEEGVSQADLGRQFGISYQRIHQIVHR